MTKVYVISNESHSLFPEQRKILDDKLGEWEILKVPAKGWTIEEMDEVMKNHFSKGEVAVFASPIPYMLARLAFSDGAWSWEEILNHRPDSLFCSRVWIFHNDIREKKELPDGKVIQVVAKEGWQIV